MITNRLLTVLLTLNLFATLLVFRGMLVIVERINGDPSCCVATTVHAEPGVSERREAPAPFRLPPAPRAGDPTDAGGAAPAGPAVASAAVPADVTGTEPDVGDDDLDRIQAAFDDEYGDAAWTAEVNQLMQTIGSNQPELSAVTQDLVDCREQVCKLGLRYSDSGLFDEFVSQLTMSLKDDLSATLYFAEPSTVAGNSLVEVFLVRE